LHNPLITVTARSAPSQHDGAAWHRYKKHRAKALGISV
jgi:hypothetical protein